VQGVNLKGKNRDVQDGYMKTDQLFTYDERKCSRILFDSTLLGLMSKAFITLGIKGSMYPVMLRLHHWGSGAYMSGQSDDVKAEGIILPVRPTKGTDQEQTLKDGEVR
jgi:hypothetical protein